MIFKLFSLQKNIRDLFQTIKDPRHVQNIISEIILKTFTIVMVLVILLSLVCGLFAILSGNPVLWILFGVGAGISLGLFLIRWIIVTIIRNVVNRIHQEYQNFNNCTYHV